MRPVGIELKNLRLDKEQLVSIAEHTCWLLTLVCLDSITDKNVIIDTRFSDSILGY